MLAYHRGGLLSFFSLILDGSVGSSVGTQFAGDSVPETLGSNHAFSRGRQIVSFRLKKCLPVPEHLSQQPRTCISPEPGAKTKWQAGRVGWMLADLRDGLLSSFLSLIPDSSASLSAGIQSTGDSVPETLGSNNEFSRGRKLDSFRFENRLPVPEHRN